MAQGIASALAAELATARAAIAKPEASPKDFRDYGHTLRRYAHALEAEAERRHAMADAAYQHASQMPQSTDERVHAILEGLM
jgi:hypothetical protein